MYGARSNYPTCVHENDSRWQKAPSARAGSRDWQANKVAINRRSLIVATYCRSELFTLSGHRSAIIHRPGKGLSNTPDPHDHSWPLHTSPAVCG